MNININHDEARFICHALDYLKSIAPSYRYKAPLLSNIISKIEHAMEMTEEEEI